MGIGEDQYIRQYSQTSVVIAETLILVCCDRVQLLYWPLDTLDWQHVCWIGDTCHESNVSSGTDHWTEAKFVVIKGF